MCLQCFDNVNGKCLSVVYCILSCPEAPRLADNQGGLRVAKFQGDKTASFFKKTKWSRSYREINQHPRRPWISGPLRVSCFQGPIKATLNIALPIPGVVYILLLFWVVTIRTAPLENTTLRAEAFCGCGFFLVNLFLTN